MSLSDGMAMRGPPSSPGSAAYLFTSSPGNNKVSPSDCVRTQTKWNAWVNQAAIRRPAKIHPNHQATISSEIALWSQTVYPVGLKYDASQLFKPREAEQDFFKNIIESGPQDPTFLQDDDEAQVIRSSMRTLAWISYRFGNVTKDMKEAKFRQPFHDLLELAFDYPAENEELPGKLLIEEQIFVKPTDVAISDAKADSLLVYYAPTSMYDSLMDAALCKIPAGVESAKLLSSGDWTCMHLGELSFIMFPGEFKHASVVNDLGQLTMYLTTLQHCRRALGLPDRHIYGHSLSATGVDIYVSYWEKDRIAIPKESLLSFNVVAPESSTRSIAIFRLFQFLRRLVASMNQSFTQELSEWTAEAAVESLCDPINHWRTCRSPAPAPPPSSLPHPPSSSPPPSMGPPGPCGSGSPSGSGSGSRPPSRKEYQESPYPSPSRGENQDADMGQQESKKRKWGGMTSTIVGDGKRMNVSEEGVQSLSKENLENLDKVAGNNRICVDLWLQP